MVRSADMTVLHEIRRRARHVMPPVLAACIVAYFTYHAVQGDRGVLAWLRLSEELAEARATAARLAEQRVRLEHRVGLLQPEQLDPDLLGERAHELLGYARPDEVIILLSPPAPAP